jgi:hypothetical protein
MGEAARFGPFGRLQNKHAKILQNWIPAEPERSTFNTATFSTDYAADPTMKSAPRIAASAVLRVAKRRRVADTNVAPPNTLRMTPQRKNSGPAR